MQQWWRYLLGMGRDWETLGTHAGLLVSINHELMKNTSIAYEHLVLI